MRLNWVAAVQLPFKPSVHNNKDITMSHSDKFNYWWYISKKETSSPEIFL